MSCPAPIEKLETNYVLNVELTASEPGHLAWSESLEGNAHALISGKDGVIRTYRCRRSAQQ